MTTTALPAPQKMPMLQRPACSEPATQENWHAKSALDTEQINPHRRQQESAQAADATCMKDNGLTQQATNSTCVTARRDGRPIDLASSAQSLGEIAVYVQALKDHDWEYQFSEDHSVYQRGFNAYSNLTRMQKRLDAEAVLWNCHCPEAYRMHVAEVAHG